METEIPEFFALDATRKTQLVSAFLDDVGFPGKTYESSGEFFDMLDRRHAEYLRIPQSAVPAGGFIEEQLAKRCDRQHA